MKNILIGVSIVILIALIAYTVRFSSDSSDAMTKENVMKKDAMMEDNKMMEKTPDSMMQRDAMMKDGAAMMQKGSYVAYSEAATAEAVKKGKTILFFHASWCPTCRAADADILKNAVNIPSGTTILKVDYDTSTEMKKNYGVTTQHTFVQIDSTMNVVGTWRGGNTLASIVANIK